MIDGYPQALAAVAAVGAGLNAGVFFAFSTFVMRALGRLPASLGISAMQAINREAPTPWFMTALFGTAVVCVAAAVVGISEWSEPWGAYMLIGGALYLVSIVLTATYHVPRNNAIDRVDPDAPGAAATWNRYVATWTSWNHLRTLASLASAVTFVLALRVT